MHHLRALVVDDEYAARETLCRLVKWGVFGFHPPITANNGMQALQLWKERRFDLVLTDIEMPVMNGIELIEAIRHDNPSQSIVIVSCHEKFEYARRALKLGVEDYFIKDLLTEKELTAFLSAFVSQAEQMTPAAAPRQSAADDMLRLAAGGIAMTSAEYPKPGFTAAVILTVIIDDYEAQCAANGEERLMEHISAFIAETESLASYYPGGDMGYLLLEMENDPSILNYYAAVHKLANAARITAKKHGLSSVSIGASNLLCDSERMEPACGEAREAAQMRIINGPGHTILFDTIALRKFATDFQQTDYLLKCIENFSFHANTACFHLIDKLYETKLPSSFADIHYYRYINARLWALMMAIARTHGRECQSVLYSVGSSVEDVNRMENSREMSHFFKNCLLTLFAEDDYPENDHLINRVLRLIEREYAQDISLSYIADKLHINKSYLSRLFKEKTGESVMNYIAKKKVSRAKHLLAYTHMKLYEISDSLNIASPQYLSTVFKRFTGLSPNEYKRTLLEQRDQISSPASAFKSSPAVSPFINL